MIGTNRRRINLDADEPAIGQRSRNMTAPSINRKVALSVAVVAACGAALVFGITHARRDPPVSTSEATAALVASAASAVQQEPSPKVAMAQVEANASAAEPAVSPSSGITDQFMPVFDIARVERTGEAVIAGRAAPGAIVELLVNGVRHHQEVADQSGLFVMIPSPLPRGDYELTLRSRLPDGRQVTSKQNVVVALHEIDSGSQAAAPLRVPDTVAAISSPQDHAGGSSQGRRQPDLRVASGRDVPVSQLRQPTAAAPLADGGSSSSLAGHKSSTAVVTRGDSLWRISRLTYGAGTQYAVVYRANRDQIRDPNRIYPGQIFILPTKAR
jgi:nucleoid-associated protein YgaU